jgi:hypothetical protein
MTVTQPAAKMLVELSKSQVRSRGDRERRGERSPLNSSFGYWLLAAHRREEERGQLRGIGVRTVFSMETQAAVPVVKEQAGMNGNS